MKKILHFGLIAFASILLILLVPIVAQAYNWSAWEVDRGATPPNSFIAGSEPSPRGGIRQLYICRAPYVRYGESEGVHPGKLVERYCNFGFGGRELRERSYDVLTNVDPNKARWTRSSDGAVPTGAFEGGWESNPRRTLYVCRASYNRGMHPGKVVDFACNITYDGAEIPIRNYEVLVIDP